MLYSWAWILRETAESIAMGVAYILPQIVLALVLIILGLIIGSGVGRLVARGINALPIDRAFESAGVSRLIAKSGYTLRSGAIIGTLVEWFIILVFVVGAFDVLGLTKVNEFLSEVVLTYLPRVFVAALILLAAALVAEFVQKIVSGTSRAADVSSHYLLGTIAKVAIWAFAILAALNELQVAEEFVQTLFTGIVVAISLATGLAFGLGGKDAAGRYVDHVTSELNKRS